MARQERSQDDLAALPAAPAVAPLQVVRLDSRRAPVAPPAPPQAARPTLGQMLLDAGAVDAGDLLKALVIQRREAASLGEVLLAHGWVTEAALLAAMSRVWRTAPVDLAANPPDPRLLDRVGIASCLSRAAVPWKRLGGVTLVATSRPEAWDALVAAWQPQLGPMRMVLVAERTLTAAILGRRGDILVREAELSVPKAFSCRTRDERRIGALVAGVLLPLAAATWLAPASALAVLTAVAAAVLLANTALRLTAFAAFLSGGRLDAQTPLPPAETPGPGAPRLPVISMLVPLFREADIAPRLVARLSRLSYPRELLDVLLIVEEGDHLTRDALDAAGLPRWMRVVTVPAGRVQTKPRALNYALNFARGSIVGIWDAEDIPDPEQLHRAARRFAEAPPEVACLQGILDFYAPRTNFISRCFTIEYGNWFRVVLPGMARLGMIVPLGGTTLFLRRGAIERVGGWDAWNVTEDADLGARLSRFGYRVEMLPTVTQEEPNCRPRAWIKQRSRWYKGYAMTWAVHMRAPRRLLREVGLRAFLGFQVQMAGAVSGFLVAPVLWVYWLLSFGVSLPVNGAVQASAAANVALGGMFVVGTVAALANLAIGLVSSHRRDRWHLIPVLPLMALYFPLATLAAWKAIYEVVVDPFSWDKTAHGLVDLGEEGEAEADAPADPARPQVAVLGSIG